MKNYFFLIVVTINIVSCSNHLSHKSLKQAEIAAIDLLTTSPITITEERIFYKFEGISFKHTITDKNVLIKIENQLSKLNISDTKSNAVWLSVLLTFTNGKKAFLSFSGYKDFNYIRFNGKNYEWNQDLVNIFYAYIPEQILNTLPKNIR